MSTFNARITMPAEAKAGEIIDIRVLVRHPMDRGGQVDEHPGDEHQQVQKDADDENSDKGLPTDRQCAAHGWTELFADAYPHAGGPDHVALYLANAEGFEVELVAD